MLSANLDFYKFSTFYDFSFFFIEKVSKYYPFDVIFNQMPRLHRQNIPLRFFLQFNQTKTSSWI